MELKFTLSMVLCLLLTITAYGQGSMTCHDEVQVSIKANSCSQEIKPEMVLSNYDEYSNYTIAITDGYGYPVADAIITINQVGQRVMAEVTNSLTGKRCWGFVLVENKVVPNIAICDTITVKCSSFPEILEELPDIDYTGGCGTYDFGYKDDVESYGCVNEMYSHKVTRHWFLDSMAHGQSICKQTIWVEKVDIDEIDYPKNYVESDGSYISCDYEVVGDSVVLKNPKLEYLENGNPSTKPWPYGTGSPEESSCGKFVSNFYDTEFEVCGGTRKIVRTWEAYDWCTEKSGTHAQTIVIKDDAPPVLVCPKDTVILYTRPEDCMVNIDTLDFPAVVYDCSNYDYTVRYRELGTSYNPYDNDYKSQIVHHQDGSYGIEGASGDSLLITFEVEDACGHASQCHVAAIIHDKTPPVAICETQTLVSVDNFGNASLDAHVLDRNSYDNCTIKDRKIKRLSSTCSQDSTYSTFKDKVYFCCDDVGAGPVKVALRVFDADGNTNDCVVEVIVSDKNPPVIEKCPVDTTIFCDQNADDTDITGYPEIGDKCYVSLDYTDDTSELNYCGLGRIVRRWRVTDGQGLSSSCFQNIFIVEKEPLNENDIQWPSDTLITGCQGGLDSLNQQLPYLKDDSCYRLLVHYKDDYYTAEGDGCNKIIRNWIVSQECSDDERQFQYSQTIHIQDNVSPDLEFDCNAETFEIDGGDCHFTYHLEFDGSDDCTSDKDLKYSYEIDYDFDGTFKPTEEGSTKEAVIDLPIGEHFLRVSVEDLCGNRSHCDKLITIEDNPTMSIICLVQLSVALDESGEVEIWASDFIKDYQSSDCMDEEPRYSFAENVVQAYALFDCDDLDGQTARAFDLQIYAGLGDKKTSCVTSLLVTDNNGVCQDAGESSSATILSGQLMRATGEGLHQLEIELINTQTNETLMTGTDGDGHYSFSKVQNNQIYMVRPFVEEMNNSISSRDLLLLRRHILDIGELEPLAQIAADVDGNGRISTLDLLQIQKRILGLNQSFARKGDFYIVKPNEVDSDYFSLTTDYDGFHYLSISEESLVEQDFYVVRSGDVNHSYQTLEQRSHSIAKVQMLESDNRLTFKSDSDGQALYQLEFVVEVPIESVMISFPGEQMMYAMEPYNNHSTLVKLLIFNDDSGQQSELFSLQFAAMQTPPEIQLLNDSHAISNDLEQSGVVLESNDSYVESMKMKITPNPVLNHGVVEINSPTEELGKLSYYAIDGTLIYTQLVENQKGENRYKIPVDRLQGQSLILVNFESATQTLSKKLVIH